MKKVAIDFREAAQKHRAGKGEYVDQLVRALLAANLDAHFVLLTLAGQRIDLPGGSWTQKSFGRSSLLWHLLVYLWLEFVRPVDVYLASTSATVSALLRSVPSVTTLFDFTAWRHPATHLPRAVALERLFLPWAIKFSKKLLAISNFTKQEAIKLFGVSPDKIIVTPMAADDSFCPLDLKDEQRVALQRKYSLPPKFILYLGTIEPRKNVEFIVRSFGKIKSQVPDTKLVLAGSKGWYAHQILRSIDQDIILTGYIDKEDRPALYNLASVFVFPSHYEGFGMPPLEAMACGTPTIVSDRASLPEVVGDGARIVALEDPNSLAEVMLEILKKPAADGRPGIERAKRFSWDITAQKTWEVLDG